MENFNDQEAKLVKLGGLLIGLQETSLAAIPLLEKIEKNTSQKNTITRTDIRHKPISDWDRPRDKQGRFVAANATVQTVPSRSVSMAKIVDAQVGRDVHGRFTSSKSQDAHAQQQQFKERKSILKSLKNGFSDLTERGAGRIGAGTVEEAAGKAVGGPFFEAAMELKEATQHALSEDSLIGKAIRRKMGGPDEKGRFAVAEKADERRHKELVQAVEEIGGKGGDGSSSLFSLPIPFGGGKGSKVPKVPGGAAGKVAQMASRVLPLLASLPVGAVAAGVAAVGAMGAAAYSIITGKDNPVSQFAQKIGLTPKLKTDSAGRVTGVEGGTGARSVTFTDTQGNVKKRIGGSRSWRNNNPGNIEAGAFARSKGAVGSDGRFAIFPSYEAGRKAKGRLIFESNLGKSKDRTRPGWDKGYRDKTLTEMVEAYAPPKENNTRAYQGYVLKAAGVSNKRMADYTPAEREKILNAMEQIEGFRAGREEVVGRAGQTQRAAIAKPGAPVAPISNGQIEQRRPTAPERMSTKQQTKVPPLAQSTVATPGSCRDLSQLTSALSGLVATMGEKEKAGARGLGNIPTEFDDTMLTLMAYDRV